MSCPATLNKAIPVAVADADARPLHHPGLCAQPRRDHLYRSRRHLAGLRRDPPRSRTSRTIEMGWVLGIFGWAYALFEIPGGWLADRIGPRRVLMRIVLVVVVLHRGHRLGVERARRSSSRARCSAPAKPAAIPSLTRVFTIWLPRQERERAQAMLWLVVALERRAHAAAGRLDPEFVSWRRAFELFGVLGVDLGDRVLPVVSATTRPTHPAVNQAELALLPPANERRRASRRGIPWRLLVSSPSVWLLCLQYVCLAYGWWFYVTWLPTYLREARGTTVTMGALLAGLPLLLGGIRLPGLGVADAAADAPAWQRRQGAAVARHHRIRRRVGLHRAVHARRGSGARDVRARPRRVLQRLRHAAGLGRLHGRRRPLRRHRVGRDEHVRQHRRRRVGARSSATSWPGPTTTGR